MHVLLAESYVAPVRFNMCNACVVAHCVHVLSVTLIVMLIVMHTVEVMLTVALTVVWNAALIVVPPGAQVLRRERRWLRHRDGIQRPGQCFAVLLYDLPQRCVPCVCSVCVRLYTFALCE